MINQSFFDADYYLNGVASKKSNYENYHWLPEETTKMAKHLCYNLDINYGSSLLDYGCARGYLVKALRNIGINAFGYDISEWAIKNCDEKVKDYVTNSDSIFSSERDFDFIFAKDVFEHIPIEHLPDTVIKLIKLLNKEMLIIVPLTYCNGGNYIGPKDELDSSHIIRWTLNDWLIFLTRIIKRFDGKYIISASYEMPVIKPVCYLYPFSCGFFRIKKYIYNE